jgi:hypothetical protein
MAGRPEKTKPGKGSSEEAAAVAGITLADVQRAVTTVETTAASLAPTRSERTIADHRTKLQAAVAPLKKAKKGAGTLEPPGAPPVPAGPDLSAVAAIQLDGVDALYRPGDPADSLTVSVRKADRSLVTDAAVVAAVLALVTFSTVDPAVAVVTPSPVYGAASLQVKATAAATTRVQVQAQLPDGRQLADGGTVAVVPPPPAPTEPPPVTQPAPPPVTQPPVSQADAAATIYRLAGMPGASLPTPAAMRAKGGAFAQYEAQWDEFSQKHWATEGAAWSGNYYDRAAIYYLRYARTGEAQALERGHQCAVGYRAGYLEANNYGSSAHWAMMKGLAIHYALTRDPASLLALGRVADVMAAPYYLRNLNNKASGEMESRQQGKVLYTLALAADAGAQSAAGHDFRALARAALRDILASQDPDGGVRWQAGMQLGQCGFVKPFMEGMRNDGLLVYRATLADATERTAIDAFVRKSADYLVAACRTADGRALLYLTGQCGADGPGAAADLNNLCTGTLAHAYTLSNAARYLDACGALFAGSITTAVTASKNFNQQYCDPRALPVLVGA